MSGSPKAPERVPSSFAPTAPIEHLRVGARIRSRVRSFFDRRGVLEVVTPILCAAGAVETHLDPVPAGQRLLVTSPEHGMKRLLAAGSGPIYQLAHAFREGERGRLHNPEFAILEWYRPGFDHHALMDEVEDLVDAILVELGGQASRRPYARRAYRGIFPRDDEMDPLCALELGRPRPLFVQDFPAAQSAFARLRPDDPTVAERFELFVDGLELANGYHEVLEAGEVRARFERANQERRALGKSALPVDERLLGALEHGLPPCAGVALGLDRLVMLALKAERIDDVIPFPIELA